MHGFQLWANLPRSLKMTAPRYQDITARDIPEVSDDDGARVRVVCGEFWGRTGPVEGIAAQPRYVDVWVPPGVRRTLPVTASPLPTLLLVGTAAVLAGMLLRRRNHGRSGVGF